MFLIYPIIHCSFEDVMLSSNHFQLSSAYFSFTKIDSEPTEPLFGSNCQQYRDSEVAP